MRRDLKLKPNLLMQFVLILFCMPLGSVAESWMLRDSMVDKRTGTDSDDAAALIGIFQSAHATFYSEEAANN